MHETKILKEIINKAQEQGNVISIKLEIGELAGISPKHLREHLEEMVNWSIDVSKKKAHVKCKCGYKGRPEIKLRAHDFVLFQCPECGEIPEVLEGDGIKIVEVKCAQLFQGK